MREKRKRAATSNGKGLAAGERLNRNRLLAESDLRWNWIGTEAKHVDDITTVHCLRAAGLLFTKKRCPHPIKSIKNPKVKTERQPTPQRSVDGSEDADDVIVVSDNDEEPSCSKKECKENPFCLNHLGQDRWEDSDKTEKAYLENQLKGKNPCSASRTEGLPVGLKNLGATCYANAFLQVWFQDLAFRSGVFKCQPSLKKQNFKESPIFQLQVTFAALQESNKAVYNPVKLVESLRLRTTEQQDAQEFSKLFMSHLDDEFRKQPNPELQSLLSDQFEGKIVNAIVCDKCKNRSERETAFLELEVNLEKTGVLEDRIAAILAPERLEGDNKYLCAVCKDLQNATRYTEVKTLPPVLHISLLRFVYDLTTFERKKSKLPLMFPPYLNMGPFLKSSDPQRMECDPSADTLYELRGVLLHKGPSAYHGHYEAQVFSQSTQKWYQFNDEIVTPLSSFHRNSDGEVNDNVEANGKEKPAKRIKRGTKARRVDDSDVEEVPASAALKGDSSSSKRLASRDAYMLVYARRDHRISVEQNLLPPEDALAIIKASSEEHEKECAQYRVKEAAAKAEFSKTREMVFDIVQSWSITNLSDDDLFVNKISLEKWLTHWLSSFEVSESKEVIDLDKQRSTMAESIYQDLAAMASSEMQQSPSSTPPSPPLAYIIDSSKHLCRHNNLSPFINKDVKVLSRAAYGKMVDNGVTFKPELSLKDLCNQCIEDEFNEKLYQLQHPQTVSTFNALCDPADEKDGCWVSKAWIKDWQLVKPKMHVPHKNDPPPDSEEFDIRCEHGNLGLNATSRRRISYEAVQLLQQLFPHWQPPKWSERPCPECAVELNASKESKLEQRKRAENEKASLSRLNDENVYGCQALKDSACAVIPALFVDEWRAWLVKPGDSLRPESIDTTSKLCEHGQLNVDLCDASDFGDDFAVVTLREWEILQKFYPPSPLISASFLTEISEDGSKRKKVMTELPCCFDCRVKNKLDFTSTMVAVILLRSDEAVPQQVHRSLELVNGSDLYSSFGESSSSRSNGLRQSKRLKNGRSVRRHAVKIFKDWTVKDLKIAVNKVFKIPTISQQLYHRGKELENNDATVAEVEIIDKDTLYLKEIDEDMIVLDSDLDDGQTTKRSKKRVEGEAFKGTLLGGLPSSPPQLPPDSDHLSDPPPADSLAKSCPSCTFLNDINAMQCEMCENFFAC